MDMQDSKWIGFYTDPSYDESEKDQKYGAPAMYVFRKFLIAKAVRSAVLECSALGVYAAYVNGSQVDGFLEPGFTDYKKRIYSRRYDVTSLLIGGTNAFGACVGDGWYTGNVAMVRRQRFGKYPLRFAARLEITYRDGQKQVIGTDKTWQGCTGAVRENDILNGEKRDFRLPHGEIFTAGYETEGAEVTEAEYPVVPQDSDFESVQLCERLDVTYLYRDERRALVDIGQNLAGVLHVRLRGKEGTVVRIRHAEMLDEKGGLYTENLRSALNTDTLILSGKEDDFVPMFCYHGFRYAELSADGPVEIKCLEARAVHNNLKQAGDFRCSSELIGKIFKNTIWGMRSNFVSVPTDCPQRDERLGWLADAHLFARTAMYNADCRKFYARFMRDVSDDSTDEGVPDYAPYVDIFGRNNAGWADCAVILPYFHYRMYGDKQIIRDNLPVMRRHIAASSRVAVNGISSRSVYGDWLNIGEDTPLEVFCTAYRYYSLTLYLYLLHEIGQEDSEALSEKERVYAAFRENFIGEDGRLKGDTQTCYVLAYAFGLLEKESAARNLRRKFEENGMHLTTGFNGGRYLLPVLSELGLSDIAYTLILSETYPGWGYSIANGATTIWERWNSYTKESGFGDAGMNSFNHYVFGCCVEWMYRYILGIREDAPGFSQIVMAPRFDPFARLSSAEGYYDSAAGRIEVSWELVKGEYILKVRAPENVSVRFDFGDRIARKISQKAGEYMYRIPLGESGAPSSSGSSCESKRVSVEMNS